MDSGGHYLIRLVQQKRDGIWTAEYPELLGCHVVGHDPVQAAIDLQATRDEWIRRARDRGAAIPIPGPNWQYHLILDTDHTPDDRMLAEQAIEAARQTWSEGDTTFLTAVEEAA